MSIAYTALCDAPKDGGHCGYTADWSSPSMDGYRRALRREGWATNAATNTDYCPDHRHLAKERS